MSDPVDFPPFPPAGARGPQVCTSMRFYLSIINDLSLEQTRALSAHLQECPDCTAEYQRLGHATQLVASLPESEPSAHVDEAIRAAIARRGNLARTTHRAILPETSTDARLSTVHPARAPRRRGASVLALAAILLLALLAGILWRGLTWTGNAPVAFQLPASLSWNGYVMHYTQTRFDAQGHSYLVEVYQDLGTNQMHIESSMPGKFDVVVVITSTEMLGKDMMNHIAQVGHGVESWTIDGSVFDLGRLRQDLASKHASYLGKGTFKGQPVYQVLTSSGEVLLLDIRYRPVGVLYSLSGPNAGQQVYGNCQLMFSAQVAESMWDMSIPPGFQMGTLPTRS